MTNPHRMMEEVILQLRKQIDELLRDDSVRMYAEKLAQLEIAEKLIEQMKTEPGLLASPLSVLNTEELQIICVDIVKSKKGGKISTREVLEELRSQGYDTPSRSDSYHVRRALTSEFAHSEHIQRAGTRSWCVVNPFEPKKEKAK